MYFALKLIRGFFRALVSAAEPWQIALGALFGTLLGFLPLFPLPDGPSPLGLLLILLAVVINCHLGTVLLFLGLTKVLALVLAPLAVALGNACSGIAAWAATIPFLHTSQLSHTGWLGSTIIGLILAPICAVVMVQVTLRFRRTLRDRLLAQQKLVLAGSVVGNPLGFRVMCWFFGL